MVETKINCPKCRSRNLQLIEISTQTQTWQVEDGEFDEEEGDLNPGSIVKVRANCNQCNHSWTVRNAQTINECIC